MLGAARVAKLEPSKEQVGAIQRAGEYLSLVAQIAGGMLVPLLAGLWIDKRFATSPLFFLLGSGVGLAAVILQLVRLAKRSSDSDDAS